MQGTWTRDLKAKDCKLLLRGLPKVGLDDQVDARNLGPFWRGLGMLERFWLSFGRIFGRKKKR